MPRIEIKNKNNMPIGYCQEDNGITTAIHYRKGYAGRFVKSSNITFDKDGKIYCYGDGTQSLIRDIDKE